MTTKYSPKMIQTLADMVVAGGIVDIYNAIRPATMNALVARGAVVSTHITGKGRRWQVTDAGFNVAAGYERLSYLSSTAAQAVVEEAVQQYTERGGTTLATHGSQVGPDTRVNALEAWYDARREYRARGGTVGNIMHEMPNSLSFLRALVKAGEKGMPVDRLNITTRCSNGMPVAIQLDSNDWAAMSAWTALLNTKVVEGDRIFSTDRPWRIAKATGAMGGYPVEVWMAVDVKDEPVQPGQCGKVDVHEGHDWPDIHKGGVFRCEGIEPTPADCPGHGPDREMYYCDGRCQHPIHSS